MISCSSVASFPAAAEDVRASYFGLLELGCKKIAVTGDSAGGNLALGLLISLKASPSNNLVVPVAGVALSPVTDLSLSGASWATRAASDPYFTQSQATELVRSYLNGADSNDPFASPLRADLAGLPPTRVHVGDDEVLLDDSVRFVFSGKRGPPERRNAGTPADWLIPFRTLRLIESGGLLSNGRDRRSAPQEGGEQCWRKDCLRSR